MTNPPVNSPACPAGLHVMAEGNARAHVIPVYMSLQRPVTVISPHLSLHTIAMILRMENKRLHVLQKRNDSVSDMLFQGASK